jgi:Mrp family chromosome partitioning ATPase/capsular polysaccharide biosynthesis protein
MDEETFALRDVLRILRHRRWQIAGVVALLVLAALIVSFLQPKRYTAEAQLVIGPAVPDAALPDASGGSDAGPLGLDLPAETQARILMSPLIGTRVAKDLGLSTRRAQIRELTERVDAKAVTDNLLLITAGGSSPAQAAAVANGYAKAYLDYRREAAAKALQSLSSDYLRQAEEARRGAESLANQIKAASARGATVEVARLTSRRDDLLERERSLVTSADRVSSSYAPNFSSGEIITPASVAGQSSSPNPYRNVLIGIILGGAAGVSIALLREHVNDRVRTRDEAVRAANAPVLAALPKSRVDALHRYQLVTVHAPRSMVSEAYRQLRRNLVRRGLGNEVRFLLVTSVEAGPEVSETVANLALLCARASQPTIAISANFRHSDLHTYFGISDKHGLAGVLSDAEEEPAETSQATFSMALSVAETNLLVLPSGRGSLSPGQVFTSAPLDHIFSMAAEMARIVIIEAPPVLSSDDAITLTAHADATLLIIRAGVDKEALTARAAAILETAGAVLLGVVLQQAQKDDDTVGLFERRGIERDQPPPGPSDGKWQATHLGNGHARRLAPDADLDEEQSTRLRSGEQRADGG